MRVLKAPFLRVTLKRSLSRRSGFVKKICESLGLKRIHQSRVYPNHPAVVGQLNKILQFVQVEEQTKSED